MTTDAQAWEALKIFVSRLEDMFIELGRRLNLMCQTIAELGKRLSLIKEPVPFKPSKRSYGRG